VIYICRNTVLKFVYTPNTVNNIPNNNYIMVGNLLCRSDLQTVVKISSKTTDTNINYFSVYKNTYTKQY
jgi:hypothetical protein